MTTYGQFCPVSKATVIVGEKALVRSMPDWFKLYVYAGVKSVAGKEEVT